MMIDWGIGSKDGSLLSGRVTDRQAYTTTYTTAVNITITNTAALLRLPDAYVSIRYIYFLP